MTQDKRAELLEKIDAAFAGGLQSNETMVANAVLDIALKAAAEIAWGHQLGIDDDGQPVFATDVADAILALTEAANIKLRCGDVVRHIPTDEEWVVAYADYETGDMSWLGWPEGMARIADCELVSAATDEVHRDWVERFTSSGEKQDHRYRMVSRLYGAKP